MQRAISISRGKGNLGHDNRDFVSANVDENRIQDNIVIKQQSLWDAYDEVFGKAVDEYNDTITFIRLLLKRTVRSRLMIFLQYCCMPKSK